MTTDWRNRLNLRWQSYKRRYIRVWVASVWGNRHEVYPPLGVGLVVWAFFRWNPTAWAAIAGFYLIATVAVKVLLVHQRAKMNAFRRRQDG